MTERDSKRPARRFTGPKLAWGAGALLVFLALVAAALKLRIDGQFVLGELFFVLAWAVVFAFWWGSRRGWFG